MAYIKRPLVLYFAVCSIPSQGAYTSIPRTGPLQTNAKITTLDVCKLASCRTFFVKPKPRFAVANRVSFSFCSNKNRKRCNYPQRTSQFVGVLRPDFKVLFFWQRRRLFLAACALESTVSGVLKTALQFKCVRIKNRPRKTRRLKP